MTNSFYTVAMPDWHLVSSWLPVVAPLCVERGFGLETGSMRVSQVQVGMSRTLVHVHMQHYSACSPCRGNISLTASTMLPCILHSLFKKVTNSLFAA